jgi:hypothetical protein
MAFAMLYSSPSTHKAGDSDGVSLDLAKQEESVSKAIMSFMYFLCVLLGVFCKVFYTSDLSGSP